MSLTVKTQLTVNKVCTMSGQRAEQGTSMFALTWALRPSTATVDMHCALVANSSLWLPPPPPPPPCVQLGMVTQQWDNHSLKMVTVCTSTGLNVRHSFPTKSSLLCHCSTHVHSLVPRSLLSTSFYMMPSGGSPQDITIKWLVDGWGLRTRLTHAHTHSHTHSHAHAATLHSHMPCITTSKSHQQLINNN